MKWAAKGDEDVEIESITPPSHPIGGILGIKDRFESLFSPWEQ